MRWLALDVGSRWVGAAVCNQEETVITPLSPMRFHGPARLAEAVVDLVEGRLLGGVVVGVPGTRAGHGRGEERVGRVVSALRQVLAVPVAEQDERGSSREAEDRLEQAGVPSRRRRELAHGVAAQVILESFVASRRRALRSSGR